MIRSELVQKLCADFPGLTQREVEGVVGAIFGIEISRLARSNAEVARLMEFAAITETLLIDADGLKEVRVTLESGTSTVVVERSRVVRVGNSAAAPGPASK